MNRKWIIWPLFILITTGVVVYGVRVSQQKQAQSKKASETVELTENRSLVAALGRLEPEGEVVEVAPPSTATGTRVAEIRIEEGERVTKGQILAVLDTYSSQLASLEEAKRQLQVAQTKLEQLKAGAKAGELNAQKATIARLQAQNEGEVSAQRAKIAGLQAELRNAAEDYQRYQSLYREGAVSSSELENRRTTLETYQEQVREAQTVLVRLQNTGIEEVRQAQADLERIAEVRPIDVAVAQAEVDSAQATVDRAQADLELTYIKSPIEGDVLQVNVQPGERITDQGLATLGRIQQMYVVAEIYETDITQVRLGQRASATSEYGGFSGKIEGTVEKIGLQINRNSILDSSPTTPTDARIVQVKIRLDPVDSERVKTLTNLQVRVLIQVSPQAS
jgi:HlyD family secretion protein